VELIIWPKLFQDIRNEDNPGIPLLPELVIICLSTLIKCEGDDIHLCWGMYRFSDVMYRKTCINLTPKKWKMINEIT